MPDFNPIDRIGNDSADKGDWNEYQRMVLSELERNRGGIEELYDSFNSLKQDISDSISNLKDVITKEHRNDIDKIKTSINDINLERVKFESEMRFKSGLWGAIAGSLPAIAAIALMIAFKS